MQVYLDHSATTPVDPQVFKAMKPYFTDKFGNPSSIHQCGQEAALAVEDSRKKISNFLNSSPEEIIFTSGATEANNLAQRGLIEKLQGKHIVVSSVEHHSVLDTAKFLQKNNVELTWLPVDKNCRTSVEKLKKAIQPNTVLVSVMYVNNEVGTIQPIEKLVNYVKSIDQKIYFHTDAVQAVQYLDCDVKRLGIDLLSLSAHKFYGPKGSGLLYIRSGTPIAPQITGGRQEKNKRAGTENVAGIVGMAKAMELVDKNKEDTKSKTQNLADKIIKGLTENIPNIELTGHKTKRAPHIVSFTIPGIEGESMLLMLDDKGIAASSGSACTSGSLKPSHVLTAMGIKPEIAHGSLRISLGKYNTEKHVDYLIQTLPPIVKKLRKMSPL